MIKPLIVIQARTGSTRFPNKINQLIGGRRMLDVVIDRARATGLKWLLARPEDFPMIPEDDVLGRFAQLLRECDPEATRFDPVIRLTADCPLLDSTHILNVLALYRLGQYALVGTGPEWDGLDVEVISRTGLAQAHVSATEPRHREHVTPWLKWHMKYYEIPLEGPALRWSVDDPSGLDFVRRVFQACALCAKGEARHTNAGGSIGGPDRQPVWDLHHLERGDLAECAAYDILKERMGGPVYVSR